jgi:hypothetical protein
MHMAAQKSHATAVAQGRPRTRDVFVVFMLCDILSCSSESRFQHKSFSIKIM